MPGESYHRVVVAGLVGFLLCVVGAIFTNVPLVELIYLFFTRMPGESYRRRLRSLLPCLCVTSFERFLTSLCIDRWSSFVPRMVSKKG